MSEYTMRDSVHCAVWWLVEKMHAGEVDDSTVYGVRDGELVPAITLHDVRRVFEFERRCSDREINDVLLTLADKSVLEKQFQGGWWVFDRQGKKVNKDKMGKEIEMWYLPNLVPTDPKVRDMWPYMDSMFRQHYRDGSDKPFR